MKSILWPCLLGALLACQAPSDPTHIQLDSGPISGITDPVTGLRVYKGIPYAAAPTGARRWQPPQPVKPWDSVRACTTFGPSPVQAPPRPFLFWPEPFLIPPTPIGEDCLSLNVWSGVRAGEAPQAVLVYIYGGGFRSGGSACPIYDGSALAQEGLVVVSLNYRVGPLGFLAHPELAAESPTGSAGNYALLDMIAALEWVQRNIAAFGGDPERVTIAGQSAGAFAVSYLTASPLARGLFHRAIAQSGGAFAGTGGLRAPAQAEAEAAGLAYAQSLGCQSLAELRALPADSLIGFAGPGTPVIDGYVLPQPVAEAYAAGQQADVPILAGWNRDDRLFGTPMEAAAFRAYAAERFGPAAPGFLAVYPATTEAEAAQAHSDLSRDETFALQAYAWARQQRATGQQPVFLYAFQRGLPAHTPETDFGAFHSGEVPYAFGTLDSLDRPMRAADYALSQQMRRYWAQFARTGDPNGPGLPPWPAFSPDQPQAMWLDSVSAAGPLPNQAQLDWWTAYLAGS